MSDLMTNKSTSLSKDDAESEVANSVANAVANATNAENGQRTNVVISADSTCDLSPELLEQYGVETFPFHIEFRGRDYLDNIDITPQELFEGYWEDKSLPTTGACSAEMYRKHFAELAQGGKSVVHFNLGSALSAAYENASAAAHDMDNVFVIDGKSLSSGVGLQVLAACRMRDQGMSAAQIAQEAERLHDRAHASFGLNCEASRTPRGE